MTEEIKRVRRAQELKLALTYASARWVARMERGSSADSERVEVLALARALGEAVLEGERERIKDIEATAAELRALGLID